MHGPGTRFCQVHERAGGAAASEREAPVDASFCGQGRLGDAALLAAVRHEVLPALGAIEAWIVDDAGYPKKGTHSLGVARQYCGQLGKQDNCQVAVSLSVANERASLPIS